MHITRITTQRNTEDFAIKAGADAATQDPTRTAIVKLYYAHSKITQSHRVIWEHKNGKFNAISLHFLVLKNTLQLGSETWVARIETSQEGAQVSSS